MSWYLENGRWLAFDDALLYIVGQDEEGWYCEYVLSEFIERGFDSAEEAKAVADADYAFEAGKWSEKELDALLDVLTDDDEDVYWDMVAHERMEVARFGLEDEYDY